MQHYARQAKDRTLIMHATEVRMRAERRAGELLAAMKKTGQRQKPGDNRRGVDSSAKIPSAPTLSDMDISKVQSSRWQKLAALSEADFEEKTALAMQVAADATEKLRKPPKPRKPKKPQKKKKVATAVIGTISSCSMQVRALVLASMQEIEPREWQDLFRELRDELDDLERVAERRKQENGHHATC